MRLRYRFVAALGTIVPACAAPSAHRGRAADHSATPPGGEAGTDATATTVATSTEPANLSADAGPRPLASADPTTTTAYVVTVPTDPPTTTTIRPRPPSTTTLPEHRYDDLDDDQWSNRERILACIRSHEGAYGTETGNGHHGAYQFVQSTWDGAAARAGLPQWVGRRAGEAPAWVQDDVAWQLYGELGFQPWPPATRYCRA